MIFFFFKSFRPYRRKQPPLSGREKSFGQAHPPSVSRRRKRPNATGRSYQGHAAHCPSLPDSPRGRSALRLLRASRRRLIGLTLVFASSNCSTGEPDRPIQGFALMLPSPRRYAVGPNETARRPPDHSADVDSVAPVGLVPPSGLSNDNAFTPSGRTGPPAGREVSH